MPDLQDVMPLIIILPFALLFAAVTIGVAFYEQNRRRNNDIRIISGHRDRGLAVGHKPIGDE